MSKTYEHDNDEILTIFDEPQELSFYNYINRGDFEEVDEYFIERIKKWKLIGEINTGCDSDCGKLWLDIESNTICASDGRDEIHYAVNVADNIQEILEMYKKHGEYCEADQQFENYAEGFIDMLVWNESMFTEDTEDSEAISNKITKKWLEIQTRNIKCYDTTAIGYDYFESPYKS